MLNKIDHEKVQTLLKKGGSLSILYRFSDKVELRVAIQVLTSALCCYTNGEDIDWDSVTACNIDYHKKGTINGSSVNASNEVFLLVPTTGVQSDMAWVGVAAAVLGRKAY